MHFTLITWVPWCSFSSILFSELRWGKAMVAYKRAQQRKKEASERLRNERDQIKFIDLRFERLQVGRFQRTSRGLDV